jgi:hypothetical protein
MLDQAEIGRLRIEARETVKAAASDLADLTGYFPVPDAKLESTARILDKLSEELAEAAGMLRRSGLRQVTP